MHSRERPAICLLSGGIDSATSAAMAIAGGFTPHALTFQYGQRHAVEVESARNVVAALGIRKHLIQTIDLRAFGGSALTADIAVPKDGSIGGAARDIPITYVHARNTIFLSFALAHAEVVGAHDIFIGVNAVDYSGYPDCRPAFIAAFEHLACLATRAGVEGSAWRIHAPLVLMSKGDIIREALRLGVDLSLTHSCYDPDPSGRACGRCESCHLRRKGFVDAGVPDPTKYSRGVDRDL